MFRQLLATVASLSRPAPPRLFSLVQAALGLSGLFSGTVSEKLNGREWWMKSQKAKKDLESMFDIRPLKNSTPSSPGKLLGATERSCNGELLGTKGQALGAWT